MNDVQKLFLFIKNFRIIKIHYKYKDFEFKLVFICITCTLKNVTALPTIGINRFD